VCGFAGFAGDVPLDRQRLEEMGARLVHRGPDEGRLHFVPGEIGLSFRRLSIIDLDGGHQPLFSEDGTVAAVCNGEIYNFESLRRRLRNRGHTFATSSDAEVIVHLYEEHGADFVNEIEGMFAIAIWDFRRRELLLVRDRLGVKPLFWADQPKGVLFASEPPALLAAGLIPRRPDIEALGRYLALQYVPAPDSGYEGIRRLDAGEMLRWRPGSPPKICRYWSLDFTPTRSSATTEERLDELDSLMRAATAARLVADVEVGAFLSGGIDSSIVVSYMAELSPSVRTFAIDFSVAGFGEGVHARRVAELYGTTHEEFTVAPDALPIVGDMVDKLGEPFADSSAVPTYLLARMTRSRVTVALSGDAGDEVFGGYERYRAALAAESLGGAVTRGVASRARCALPDAFAARRPRVARALAALALPSSERYPLLMSHFSPSQVASLAEPEAGLLTSGAQSAWTDTLALPDLRGVNRYTALDTATYLPGDLLTKVDRMSMAHSLEVRSPMLDYRVHEYGARLNSRLKVRRGRLKWLLKQLALRRGLPPDLVHRPKQGFGIPVGRWFRGELRPWLVDVLTDPRSRGRGLLRPAGVDVLIAEHVDGRADHTARLWNLMMLELWFRAHIDADG